MFLHQTNLNISTTWFLSNPVATHVLHLWSLLLVHLPGPLSKSLIALFSTLHLVYGTNSPLIFVSLVRHSLLHFHLSHMAYHHHLPYHLHDHHLHLLLLVLSFFLNLRLGSLPNHFLHRLSPFLPDWFHGLTDHLTFYSAQRLDLFARCVRLSRLLVGFQTHFKSLHFHSFIHSYFEEGGSIYAESLHGSGYPSSTIVGVRKVKGLVFHAVSGYWNIGNGFFVVSQTDEMIHRISYLKTSIVYCVSKNVPTVTQSKGIVGTF